MSAHQGPAQAGPGARVCPGLLGATHWPFILCTRESLARASEVLALLEPLSEREDQLIRLERRATRLAAARSFACRPGATPRPGRASAATTAVSLP